MWLTPYPVCEWSNEYIVLKFIEKFVLVPQRIITGVKIILVSFINVFFQESQLMNFLGGIDFRKTLSERWTFLFFCWRLKLEVAFSLFFFFDQSIKNGKGKANLLCQLQLHHLSNAEEGDTGLTGNTSLLTDVFPVTDDRSTNHRCSRDRIVKQEEDSKVYMLVLLSFYSWTHSRHRSICNVYMQV